MSYLDEKGYGSRTGILMLPRDWDLLLKDILTVCSLFYTGWLLSLNAFPMYHN